ncbi:hypothetical protein PROFUN_10048 [Planoprotostelium fungivorum]|uniref:RING-type E3 ubiquitin transferase n=1 Tax=Planoprotostelium fungivorum TaxID=1890364 RepID=A0A2P6NFF1_9EUKA|nr:hypothetical protein PROFUN_10048 [Planoprotostelium fungivorum]
MEEKKLQKAGNILLASSFVGLGAYLTYLGYDEAMKMECIKSYPMSSLKKLEEETKPWIEWNDAKPRPIYVKTYGYAASEQPLTAQVSRKKVIIYERKTVSSSANPLRNLSPFTEVDSVHRRTPFYIHDENVRANIDFPLTQPDLETLTVKREKKNSFWLSLVLSPFVNYPHEYVTIERALPTNKKIFIAGMVTRATGGTLEILEPWNRMYPTIISTKSEEELMRDMRYKRDGCITAGSIITLAASFFLVKSLRQ